MSLAEEIVKRGGGMVACGEHLGVYVGTDIMATPPAWLFVPIQGATKETVQAAIDHVKKGRATWPDKEDGTRPVTGREVIKGKKRPS